MADTTYKELKLKQQNLSQEILKKKNATQTYKDIVEDSSTSDKDRKKYKEMYDASIAETKDLEKQSSEIKKDIDKSLGKISVEQVKKQYDALKKELDIQLDPASKKAESIQKKIDALVPKYQEAYSKAVGTRVSASVAKGELTGSGASTFGEPSVDNAITPAPTPVQTQTTPAVNKPAVAKKPDTTKLPALGWDEGNNPPGQKQTPAEGGLVFDVPGQAKPIQGPGIIEAGNASKANALEEAAKALDLTGTLFEHVPSLKNLLDQYVKNGWTNARFLQELRNDTWYKKNSSEIKQRYVQLYNYQDLVASGQADGSTDYEKQIEKLKADITNKARQMGSGLASDPAAVQRAAENMYITNTAIDDALTTNIIAAAIRPIGSTIGGKPTQGYSGKALQDYQTIQAAAKANGFKVSDIIPGGTNEQQVLQGIATGAIDVNRIAQDARKLAAQGQPQYVRDLLGQGYNLDQVYAPYRKVMGTVLEVNPDQIDLNDPLLRTAITDKGDMNLYDFKKAMRADNRWQYTEQAKTDVSQAALTVLKDFGFQG
jgi:hypothetical protein